MGFFIGRPPKDDNLNYISKLANTKNLAQTIPPKLKAQKVYYFRI